MRTTYPTSIFTGLAIALTISGCDRSISSSANLEEGIPSYLSAYADRYRDDPRAANLQWFQDAKYGLFIHFGLYSLLEEGE